MACYCSAGLAGRGPARGQPRADWPTYGHDAGGQRYSPVAEITPENVAQLEIAWTYHMRPQTDSGVTIDVGAARQLNVEGLGAPARSQSVRRFPSDTADGRRAALPHDTLRTRSRTRSDEGSRVLGNTDSRPRATFPARPRILARRRHHAAATLFRYAGWPAHRARCGDGRVRGNFGDNGVVQLATAEILQGGDARFYGMTSPPLVYGDLVITGSAVQEFPPRGAAGDVRAWDARTGALEVDVS